MLEITVRVLAQVEADLGFACFRCSFQSDSLAQGCHLSVWLWDTEVLLVAFNITHHKNTTQTHSVCVPELQPGKYTIQAREIFHSGELASTLHTTTVTVPEQGLYNDCNVITIINKFEN